MHIETLPIKNVVRPIDEFDNNSDVRYNFHKWAFLLQINWRYVNTRHYKLEIAFENADDATAFVFKFGGTLIKVKDE